MTEKGKNILLRSEEVQDILSRPPHSLIRTGSSVIGAIVMIMFIGCFLFKYPDKITCKATVTGTNPPTWIIAKSTGKIKELRVTDGTFIEKDGIIAVIENPASTEEVLKLDTAINKMQIIEDKEIRIGITANQLGDIQEYYNSFIKAVTEYNNFVRNNLYDEKIRAEEKQLKPYAEYTLSAERQLALSSKQNRINETNYKREKKLHEKELTSTADMETAEQELISGQMSMEQMKTSLANARIQAAGIRNNISELQIQKEQERKQAVTALQTSIESLKNAIEQWKQNYVLTSPVNGIVSYNNIWKENQNISAGDKGFSVITARQGKVIAKIKIPAKGSGKVKTGQRVNIKMDGYPYLEYGFLTGKIISVSSVPDDGTYTATVNISKSTVTSYGKNINTDGEHTGTAEIITDDLSIGERLLFPLRYLTHNNLKWHKET
ncbi:HlyD family secretion protein [Xylanibacter caecicola]|uniref:HlyD family secretion protein n=1 Tax=Xylanibacter caecicola TaxID=2736294 RepID=UPI00258A60C0|nr:HlyD family efflux transporter periplasmic adaptor subunit [Xylanibacter caecicola]